MQRAKGFGLALAAMSMVGGAVTASHFLGDYPRFGAQAVRYGIAALVLVATSALRPRWRLRRPRRREWFWLVASATAGQSVYNLAVVQGLEHAEPAAIAAFVAAVPIVLAIGAPLMERRFPPPRLVVAALTVAAGAVLVVGGGHSDLVGIALAVVALAGESGFTLFSLPVLDRLGAMSVATHTAWIAAAQLAVVGVLADGRHALEAPDRDVVLAIGYLVLASAAAFAAWFAAVEVLGGAYAGLAAGVIPVAAAVTGASLGVATIDLRTGAGTALVAIGVAAGLQVTRSRPAATAGARSGENQRGV